jgi:hypothetical protein
MFKPKIKGFPVIRFKPYVYAFISGYPNCFLPDDEKALA